jgi:DNA-directed RNA polymerase specialized sigma24 family protein
MKPCRDAEFESLTMPYVNALFQTALQLSENPASAEELVREAYSHAWKSFRRRDDLTDWRVKLFKVLIARARRRPANLSGQGQGRLSGIPWNLKEVILLVDGQDFSYQEAAHILDSSRDAVAEAIVLARTHLESRLMECIN